MANPPYSDLIDPAPITAARAARVTQVTKLATAQTQVDAAAQALTTAKSALSDAIQGKGSTAPVDADKAVDDAARALRLASMMRDAAQNAVKDADGALFAAEAKAWRAVYLAGVRKRLAAVQAADTARQAIAQAEADFADGVAMLGAATSHGVLGVSAAMEGSMAHRMTTYADESRLWSVNQFDPVAGTFPLQWN